MWLVTDSIWQEMRAAIAAGNVPTPEQERDFRISAMGRYDEDTGAPRILTVAGNTARITIDGLLTKNPSLFAMIFGGGNLTYGEIVDALTAADADPEVASIELYFDSTPGGALEGLYETATAIRNTAKPVRAFVAEQAASASYALASQADRIEAAHRMTAVGSVGVATNIAIDETVVTLTNDDSPNKRPDVTTDEGKRTVVDMLNRAYGIMADMIAQGRRTTADAVNRDYGRGGMLFAEEALRAGMIDAMAERGDNGIRPPTPTPRSAPAETSTTSEGSTMDLEKLKAEHPATFAEAVKLGANEERDRVVAHLNMGLDSGAMETAAKAIREGTGMTHTLMSEYMIAGRNAADQSKRNGDDGDAAAAADGSQAAGEDGDTGAGDGVPEKIAAEMGAEDIQA